MTAQRPPRPGSGRGRRWPRLAIPYSILLVILLGSTIAYSVQQPDPTDRAYLSPNSDAAIGGHRLAQLLTTRGVTVRRETGAAQALVAAASGQTTLFIPTPAFVHPFQLRMIKLLPASTRVVLVAPDNQVLSLGNVPARVVGSRLAATARAADCVWTPATQAGTASVVRKRYASWSPVHQCYGGGLTVVRRGAAEVVLVGADDPFRNDRIGEHHNSTLATALLSTTTSVIWLDLHKPERQPDYVDDPALASQPPAPPLLGRGSPDPEFYIPDTAAPKKSSASAQPEGAEAPNPLWDAAPPWTFATVALLALGAVLFALAMGRRLGGPVREPLPIVVRTTETVEGRGRLYQRAKARGPAATTLRVTCRQRLVRLLGLGKDADPPTIVAAVNAVTAQAGWPAGYVELVLYGGEPADDRELIRLALDTEALVRTVTHYASPPTADPPTADIPGAPAPGAPAPEGDLR